MVGGSNRNIGGLAAKRRRNIWIGVAFTLALLLGAGAGVVIAVKPWTEEFRHGGLTIAAPPEPVKPLPQVAPAPSNAPAPTPSGVAAALAQVVANPDLGAFALSLIHI